MTRIKYIARGFSGQRYEVERDGCLFIADPGCTEYDWLVVYDDVTRKDTGTVINETEVLACPKSHTILVTQEPPTIKIYPKCYTSQFGHVITTHLPDTLPHPNHHQGHGALHWMANYPLTEAFAEPEYPKTKIFSTVCSNKQMKHTAHHDRFTLTKYISEHLPELDWYGRGVKALPGDKKYAALNDYKYHLAVENYIYPYHWTDKITDPILGLCLTFYAGDPKLAEVLPSDCFIPIPLDNHEEALRIIRDAIQNNEYEKRLPSIREARHLLVTKYNFYNQVTAVVHAHEAAEKEGLIPLDTRVGEKIIGRHTLRRNPINAISEAWELLRYKLFVKKG